MKPTLPKYLDARGSNSQKTNPYPFTEFAIPVTSESSLQSYVNMFPTGLGCCLTSVFS